MGPTEKFGLAAEGLVADLLLPDVRYWNMDKMERISGVFKRTGEAGRERPGRRPRSYSSEPTSTSLGMITCATDSTSAVCTLMIRPKPRLAILGLKRWMSRIDATTLIS